MPQTHVRDIPKAGSGIRLGTALGVAAALLFFLISGALAYWNIQGLRGDSDKVVHTHDVITELGDLLAAIQDAETGQRGFLLTGRDNYLEPYEAALARISSSLATIEALTRDNSVQQVNLRRLKPRVTAKLAELRLTIDLRRNQGGAAALARIATDHGKYEMDSIRAELATMRAEERRLRQSRLAQMQDAYRTATLSGILAALLGIGLTLAVGVLIERSMRARQRETWLQSGEVGLAQAMLGDKTVPELAESILDYLTPYLGAQASVLFKGENEVFERMATLGVPADSAVPQRFAPREGLLGRVAAEGQPMVLDNVPEGYLTLGSGLGRDTPRHLLITPFRADGVVNSVIEFGFLHAVNER